MYKSIRDVLENTTKSYGNKTVFSEVDKSVTYKEFYDLVSSGATYLIKKGLNKKNVLIFIDKSIDCLEAMFSCMLAGSIYTVMDIKSPKERMSNIVDTLKPSLIITTDQLVDKCCDFDLDLITIDEIVKNPVDLELLDEVNASIISTDPLYVLFTSGSTGVPKGSVISHGSVIAYSDDICSTFGIDSNTVFGSQTPLYFSMSVLDVFSTIYSGATFNIIPKMYFSFPVKLIEHMNKFKINAIYWVPSALSIVANLKTFETIKPEYLKTVLFAGETMPTKQLNVWKNYIPDALYSNLFGPTEITDTGVYYVVDREFRDDEPLPIGKPFPNSGVLVLKDDFKEAPYGEPGELYFRGPFLGLGYYNNEEKTKEIFIRNPLNKNYPETIYKTGDLVKYNDRGELMYLGRKDFQIKHMGYRIELGEIESNIFAIDGVLSCACIYDTSKSKIVLFYQSNDIDAGEMQKLAKEKLLPYMVPGEIVKLDRMPMNANGKIDRVKLKEMER